MEKYTFKTNLKCNGCIAAIKPGLDAIPDIQKWQVDLQSPDRVLEIEASTDVTLLVEESVKKAGYEISRL
jgi:copper chaperone